MVGGGDVVQELVADFVSKYKLQTDRETRYIDLASEVGELGKELIKGTNYGKTAFMQSAQIEDEIGDCLFSLVALCCEMNIEAREALEKALMKYDMRFIRKGDIGSEV